MLRALPPACFVWIARFSSRATSSSPNRSARSCEALTLTSVSIAPTNAQLLSPASSSAGAPPRLAGHLALLRPVADFLLGQPASFKQFPGRAPSDEPDIGGSDRRCHRIAGRRGPHPAPR